MFLRSSIIFQRTKAPKDQKVSSTGPVGRTPPRERLGSAASRCAALDTPPSPRSPGCSVYKMAVTIPRKIYRSLPNCDPMTTESKRKWPWTAEAQRNPPWAVGRLCPLWVHNTVLAVSANLALPLLPPVGTPGTPLLPGFVAAKRPGSKSALPSPLGAHPLRRPWGYQSPRRENP